MIYLDTHVVAWLYADRGKRLSDTVRRFIEESQSILISPMVLLELDFLHEINRITCGSEPVFAYLYEHIHLEICKKPFHNIVAQASDQTWTRDPFDRIITAHAALDGNILITKDETIRNNYVPVLGSGLEDIKIACQAKFSRFVRVQPIRVGLGIVPTNGGRPN